MAVLVGAMTYLAGFRYSASMFAHHLNANADPLNNELGTVLSKTFMTFILVSIAHGLAARVIIFGFSKRLDGRIDGPLKYGEVNEKFVLFAALAILPLLAHYILFIIHACNRKK